MKSIFFVFALIPCCLYAQKLTRDDKKVLENLSAHISYLADDSLEGRRAGTKGETIANKYIQSQFEKAQLKPMGDNNGFLQSFPISDGKNFTKSSFFIVNGAELKPNMDYFPFNNSPESKLLESTVSLSLSEPGSPWFINWNEVEEQNKSNPHFDYKAFITEKALLINKKGGTSILLYNVSKTYMDEFAFTGKDQSEQFVIPVIVITSIAKNKFFNDITASNDIKFKIVYTQNQRIAHNVVGYIDNNAASTIVFGAHFDHLGFGEDGNSMLRTKEKFIHNGDDDNASGTAVLMELASSIRKQKLKSYNYLFIAFSGEELGLLGSKYYTDHPTINLSNVSYMINMDMVGRLNDSTKTITIGGIGTSPAWGDILPFKNKQNLTIKVDSSGTGPSDHTSFYRKDIPVLFFFTGLHSDYHKPSDDFSTINVEGSLAVFNLINIILKRSDAMPKLAFTKTKEQTVGSISRFTVSLGIMPDYSFGDKGVRVDGISDGKLAQKVGIIAGDVIVKLGTFPTSTVTSYMEALSKFKKGDATTVYIERNRNIIEIAIQF